MKVKYCRISGYLSVIRFIRISYEIEVLVLGTMAIDILLKVIKSNDICILSNLIIKMSVS